MDHATQTSRTFHVHARNEGRDHSHRVEAKSFEEAAIGFVERWHCAQTDEGAVSVLVAEGDTGSEHCFTVHLDEGDASPCG